MKIEWGQKKAGFFVLLAALAIACAAIINYLTWSLSASAFSLFILCTLAAGFLCDLGVLFLDSDYLLILSTAFYACGMMQLAVDSAGSFADAYQGIVMFGDPSQVGRILSICVMAALAIILNIVAGFMGRGKAEAK